LRSLKLRNRRASGSAPAWGVLGCSIAGQGLRCVMAGSRGAGARGQVEAGRRYWLVAAAWGPGVESAVVVTACAPGCSLVPCPPPPPPPAALAAGMARQPSRATLCCFRWLRLGGRGGCRHVGGLGALTRWDMGEVGVSSWRRRGGGVHPVRPSLATPPDPSAPRPSPSHQYPSESSISIRVTGIRPSHQYPSESPISIRVTSIHPSH
jgi:hypothetical protein